MTIGAFALAGRFLPVSLAASTALLVAASAPAVASDTIGNVSITKITTPFDDVLTLRMKHDGKRYVLDEAKGGKLRVRLQAEAKGGISTFIEGATGRLANRAFYSLPLGYHPRKLDETLDVAVAPADLAHYAEGAVSQCDRFGKHGGKVELGFPFSMSFEAFSQHRDGAAKDTATYIGAIECGPRRAGSDDLAGKEPAFRVTGIDISLAPSAAATSHPSQGLACKDGKLAVTVRTSKAGALSFRLHTKIGKVTDSKPVLTWAKHVGNGKFEAIYKTSLKVTGTAEVQAMAEDLVNPIGLSSGWKLATLHCSATGVGDLAAKPGTGNPDAGPKAAVKPANPKSHASGDALPHVREQAASRKSSPHPAATRESDDGAKAGKESRTEERKPERRV